MLTQTSTYIAIRPSYIVLIMKKRDSDKNTAQIEMNKKNLINQNELTFYSLISCTLNFMNFVSRC